MTSTLTKQAIQDAFISLIKKKPLSQITVQEISDACQINRNTFYYHYPSIDALIEQILFDDIKTIIATHPPASSVQDCLRAIINSVQTNKTIFANIYRSVSRTTYEKYLWKLSAYITNDYLTQATSRLSVPPADRELLFIYYQSLFFGLAMFWMKNGSTNQAVVAQAESLAALFGASTEQFFHRYPLAI